MTLVKFNNRTRNSAPYFNNVFDSLFSDAINKVNSISKMPLVNIYENQEAYKIEVAAPGLNKDDFQINVKKSTLSLWAEVKKEEGTAIDYSRQEFDYNSFARSFNLPENADLESIKAEYINGILTITIAKVDEKLMSREIKVL
ncbi:Hsp20/alpha crystallin family protein [Pedobacter flavus]|uniref:Hsp20/alpha crystallin family protein n=1 Tax=Pedobacter flavus TaxID=3113906 RepID=A0ABU7H377_9SPHI|nr:Hsp20/alpha crystallin family protein [Pedobacter sp. VNH31]MEE1885774.1 Hsp20/alpha crystallin family protein [Pedobacter sp. VNH31]